MEADVAPMIGMYLEDMNCFVVLMLLTAGVTHEAAYLLTKSDIFYSSSVRSDVFICF